MVPPPRSSEWLKHYAEKFKPWPLCGRCNKRVRLVVDYDWGGKRWFLVAMCHGETEHVPVDERVLWKLQRKDITLEMVFADRLPGSQPQTKITPQLQRDRSVEFIPEGES